MDNDKIGKFITEKRVAKGLTQNELGSKLFVTGKAVSKWERGLSLPDISILEKLAEVLDTDIYSILQIENKKDTDINQKIIEEKKVIKKRLIFTFLKIFIPLIILLFIILIKILPFGYDVEHVRYVHNTDKIINLGKPKFSFLPQSNEDSFSYKNIRGKNILTNEVKSYVNTLTPLLCNDTRYYYDKNSDTTIIDYYISSNILYSTINYSLKNGNYCNQLEYHKYNELLNFNMHHFLYAEESNLYISFVVYGKYNNNTKNEYSANLYISYSDKEKGEVYKLEESNGTIEIINDELFYYRSLISFKSDKINIPNVSRFIIKNDKFILEDDYLASYEKSIVLK